MLLARICCSPRQTILFFYTFTAVSLMLSSGHSPSKCCAGNLSVRAETRETESQTQKRSFLVPHSFFFQRSKDKRLNQETFMHM